MEKLSVIIDNGHGADTPGKRSPDGRLREWQWTRRLAAEIESRLAARGVEALRLVPEDADVSIAERCRRADKLSRGRRAVLISLHTNAAGDGSRWFDASGWSVFVAPGASASSRRLASLLADEAAARGLLGNRAVPPEGYHTASLGICRRTRCPAVLTENMFHDNRADVAFLLSNAGLDALASLHVDALLRYRDGL